MNYRKLTKKEYDRSVIDMIDVLFKPIPFAGKHRKDDWIKGWKSSGNYPQYFGKHRVNRLNSKLVYALSKNYERNALYSLLTMLFKKYFSNERVIYEFGCGTGHNLRLLGKINKTAELHGSDWANKSWDYFDFFKPKGTIKPNSAVYTIAALEQTGTNYKKFVSWLIKQKPSIVLHIEPIEELLDPNVLLDYLSIRYFRKRKYLKGYLTHLRKLEKQGKIKIHTARRSGIGSKFVDGYSIIAWSPN